MCTLQTTTEGTLKLSRTDVFAWFSSLSVHLLAGAALFSYQSAQVTVVRGRAPGALPTPSAPVDTRLADEAPLDDAPSAVPLHIASTEPTGNEPRHPPPPSKVASQIPPDARPPSPMLGARPRTDHDVARAPRRSMAEPAESTLPVTTASLRELVAELPDPPNQPRRPPDEQRRRAERRDRPVHEQAEAALLAQVEPGQTTPRRDSVPSNQPPAYEHNPPPPYPPEAVRRRLEGRVLLTVHVRADGTVERLEIAQSSGHSLLDRAALQAVRNWRFEPARRLGTPVASTVRVPVRFRLEE